MDSIITERRPTVSQQPACPPPLDNKNARPRVSWTRWLASHSERHLYSTKAVTLPVNSPTDPKLIAQADWAYVDYFGYGFAVTDHSPSAAGGFAQLYSASGVSRCVIQPALKYEAEMTSLFAFLAACDIMGWPAFRDIDTHSGLWSTTIAPIKEILSLGLYGEAGKKAADEVTEEGYAASRGSKREQRGCLIRVHPLVSSSPTSARAHEARRGWIDPHCSTAWRHPPQ